MFTNHRDRRNRREALFTLESLDERLVLSATAAGAVTSHAALVEQRHEARHEAKLARIEARHEAKVARFEARHPAQFASASTPAASMSPVQTMTPAQTTATATPAPVASPAQPSPTTTATPTTTASPTVATPTAITVATSSTSATTTSQTTTTPTNPTTTTPTNLLPSNVSAALQSLYSEYENAGSGGFTPSQPSDTQLKIVGDSVAVNLKVGTNTSFNSALSQLQSEGMQVTASSATYDLIDGLLPIADLPVATSLASSVTATSPSQPR